MFVALATAPPKSNDKHFFTIDNELVYWNFFLDFGPLNLGHVYKFCAILNAKLSDPRLENKTIYFYSGTHPHKRTNAAFLICAWAILYLKRSAEDAYAPFRSIYPPFPTWHDATPSRCYFNLTVLDTLKGLEKAMKHNYFDHANFNRAEYEHFEQVENGDLNWCLDGKFIAFAGPHACSQPMEGYFALAPDDYIPYFKKRNVTLVIRFNQPYYDAKRFTSAGIDHADLYFVDGTNPPLPILQRFLQICEETPGAVAVHCKAGLGRTGTCIGCYMMKHYGLTAEETIGWLRVVRPGSVIGPQQQFLKDIQPRMWQEGERMRERLGLSSSPEIATHEDSLSQSLTRMSVNAHSETDTLSSRQPLAKPASASSASRASSGSTISQAAGRRVVGSSAVPTVQSEGEGGGDKEGGGLTQGDTLRLRRAQGMKSGSAAASDSPPPEAKPSSAYSTGSAPSSRPPPSSSSSTRAMVARYLGK